MKSLLIPKFISSFLSRRPSLSSREEEEGNTSPGVPNASISEDNSPIVPSLRPELPYIRTKYRHLREVTAEAKGALDIANNPPKLFIRSGSLVRIITDENDHASIELVNENILRSFLERSANFMDGTFSPIPPPRNVVQDLFAINDWDFPPLSEIVEMPILRPDGTILFNPGYDDATKLFLQTNPELDVDPIPETPTPEQIQSALSLLEETIHDFPFVGTADRANALGLMITPFVRPAVNGNVPLALVDAPQAGTAKTLLCKVISLIGAGHQNTLTTAPNNPEEWRKKITSILIRGGSIIVFDNVDSILSSDDLAAALTTQFWSDRLLGHSRIVSVPQLATWIANGNNLKIGGDLPRRAYWIRLDAKSSKPWQRSGFLHEDLIGWVSENRGRLIWSILALVRAWVVAGKPTFQGVTIGGFTEWVQVVGGILENAGIHGFLANIDELYEVIDLEGNQWDVFLLALHERFCNREVSVKVIIDLVYQDSSLRETIPEELEIHIDHYGTPNSKFATRLGGAFRSRTAKHFGASEVRIERGKPDPHFKVARWRFIRGDCGVCGDLFRQNSKIQSSGDDSAIFRHSEDPANSDPATPAPPAD